MGTVARPTARTAQSRVRVPHRRRGDWTGGAGVGILAIPYPGPGWAIVFVGLGILATEFDWARRLLAYAQERYDKVMDWFKRQGLWVQVLGAALTAAVVVATLWLLGAVGFFADLVGLEHELLKSPIGLGS